MTHEQLIILVGGIHGMFVVSAFISLYQCGSWSERFRTWLKDVNEQLDNLRRGVAFELANKLEPVFKKTSNISQILNSQGEYCEQEINPAGSEEYRNAIGEYVEGGMDKLLCWRSLYIIRQAYFWWAKYFSWSVVVLIIIELFTIFTIAAIEKIFEYSLPDKLIWGTFIFTAILVLNGLVGLMFSLIHHNSGMKERV